MTLLRVGALFDIISGKRSRGPVWLQRLGFEWLYRLYQEPRRQWRRYTLGNVYFVFLIVKELLKSSR
ncbi:WecB/TagA/CpsF family glycosyltransferase [Candidatus Curtissbacteria bacterium]|nr:WecB/TagA/CpsF family glycosyltransferase [Candidatus Curtissbacteria bacterium]